eukprot:1159084-Pelagomonas_calceolata.AAC.17
MTEGKQAVAALTKYLLPGMRPMRASHLFWRLWRVTPLKVLAPRVKPEEFRRSICTCNVVQKAGGNPSQASHINNHQQRPPYERKRHFSIVSAIGILFGTPMYRGKLNA